MSTVQFNRITIIGLGHIGSSIARAVKQLRHANELEVPDGAPDNRTRAAEIGLGDRVAQSNGEAVKDSDLVIVCVPVGNLGKATAEIAQHLKAGAIVSDVGSVKGPVTREMASHLPKSVHLVPGHPVAGTEDSGPDSGFAELFINRWCILTPLPDADAAAVEKLATLWRTIGANVETMSPDHHDLVLAVTSHLPHLIAYTIVGTAEDMEKVTEAEVLKFSAGGFRDFTRIAAADPTMWRDIFLANKEAVLEMLGTFQEDLSKLTRAIRHGDGEALFDHFTRTRAIRRGIVNLGQDSSGANFGRPTEKLPQDAKPATPAPSK